MTSSAKYNTVYLPAVDPEAQFAFGSGLVREVDQCSQEEWAQILCQFEDATCDQSCAFGQDRWGEGRISHIVIRRNGEPVAAAQIILLIAPVINKGIAYVKMGPLWRRKGLKADPEALELILQAINQEYRERRALMVMCLLPPDPDFGADAEKVMSDLGFKLRRPLVDPNRYLVNVSLSPEEQLQSLQQKWRYNLRKSLKNDFEISVQEGDGALAEFMSLYEPMLQRKGFRESTPINGLKGLCAELPAAYSPQIVIVRHEGRATAGAVVVKIGTTASYLFGATDDRALPLKAGYALQWWIIERLCADPDVHWYDLGGEAMEPGLRQFKKGLTGKSGQIVELPGEFESWSDPLSWLVAESGTGLRTLLRGAKNFDRDALRDWFKK